MRSYATESDYYDFTGEPDPNEDEHGDPVAEPTVDKALVALLRRASAQVDSHLRAAVYDTDDEGYPTDETVTEALRDATCAYAAYWQDTGDITGADAVGGPVKILSVSLGGNPPPGGATQARRADEAVTILRNAGLITAAVQHT